jgi:hypothetical protein
LSCSAEGKEGRKKRKKMLKKFLPVVAFPILKRVKVLIDFYGFWRWCITLSFWTLPIVQYSKEHNISETGSVSVLSWRGWRHLFCWVC